MRIRKIQIENVGGLKRLELSFDPHFNVICGENGVGKTTLIECVAHSFSHGPSEILKRHALSDEGKITTEIDVDGALETIDLVVDSFEPTDRRGPSGRHDLSPKLLSIKTGRVFTYKAIGAIAPDTLKQSGETYPEASTGVPLTDLKSWIVNRFLYSAHPDVLDSVQLNNFETAVLSFGMLDSRFAFSRVDPRTNEILLSTPGGEVYFEYLSSGFKSCVAMIVGIIKETELRFNDPYIAAADFDGIVVVDELELHLHPEWQARISSVLSELFPKAQFIATTHSPHIIQQAARNQIIALERSASGVEPRTLPEAEFAYQGWTVEEILEDVMGMRTTRSALFQSAYSEYEAAVGVDETAERQAADALDRLLHPSNPLRKVLRLTTPPAAASNDPS